MMAWMLSLLNGLVLLAWLIGTARAARFRRSGFRPDRAPADGLVRYPRLSVIVAARNEEAALERAARTLLALDYPDLEIVAVDDRSSDATGAILDRLAAEDPRLRAVHVRDLPAGWLGKTHALHGGSRRATGDWLLFTDADVQFEPTALRRAVGHAVGAGIDHLVLLPEVVMGGFWERVLVGYFCAMFSFRFEPWRVADPKSRAHIGVGAFNLVRAAAYRKAGGHAALRMDVLDDVKLGKVMKASGGRQACGFGGGLVRVRWAKGVRGVIGNLQKNMFAGFGYRPVHALIGIVQTLLLCAWPAVGLFIGPWAARAACLGVLACMMVMVRAAPAAPGVSPILGLAYPIASCVFCYAVLRSMVLTYRHGGVVWRGTLYPLAELRRGVV